MWIGSTLSGNAKQPRRRAKGKRRGTSGVERTLRATARAVGLAPRAKRADERGVCVDHAYALLGFADAWQLVAFLDSLRKGRKHRRVRLPAYKRPAHCRAVIGVCCQQCGGTGRFCAKCEGFGWGIVLLLRKPRAKKEQK